MELKDPRLWLGILTPLSQYLIKQAEKKKISNNIKKLNNTINRFDLIVIYRTLHPTATIDIFFLSIQGVFNQGGQMLVHKTNYRTLENNKYKELCSLSKVELT